MVSSVLKHATIQKFGFTYTDTNILRVLCVHLLLIVYLDSKLYFKVSYFVDFCFYCQWRQIKIPTKCKFFYSICPNIVININLYEFVGINTVYKKKHILQCFIYDVLFYVA